MLFNNGYFTQCLDYWEMGSVRSAQASLLNRLKGTLFNILSLVMIVS
jgi:hypothetical protein